MVVSFFFWQKNALKIATEWLVLSLLIREALGSYIGPETGDLIDVFVIFISPSRQMLGQYLKSGHYRFLSYTFPFINHPFDAIFTDRIGKFLNINKIAK